MVAAMLSRATSAGLFDRPPLFGLTKVYTTLAAGIIATLTTPTSTVITTLYGPGQPATLVGTATAQGLSNLDAERFAASAQALSSFIGVAAPQFFSGVAGVISYLEASVTFLDLLTPTGNGSGAILAGGIAFDATSCVDNIKDAAPTEEVLVCVLGRHVFEPTGTLPDPITGAPIPVGEFFSTPELLVNGVASALSLELLNGTNDNLLVAGSFVPPPAAPITAPTLTGTFQ